MASHGAGTTSPLPQAMGIREQIGYPDYILEENKHLDEEYSNVRPHPVPRSSARPPTPTHSKPPLCQAPSRGRGGFSITSAYRLGRRS